MSKIHTNPPTTQAKVGKCRRRKTKKKKYLYIYLWLWKYVWKINVSVGCDDTIYILFYSLLILFWVYQKFFFVFNRLYESSSVKKKKILLYNNYSRATSIIANLLRAGALILPHYTHYLQERERERE